MELAGQSHQLANGELLAGGTAATAATSTGAGSVTLPCLTPGHENATYLQPAESSEACMMCMLCTR